ncbi:MAG: TetR/AcrR family transcriptional regulator [Clostridiales bacterium]|nr:TetR/AcrR family transcriptional regulator [Clostridiales bacterium]
MQVKKEEVRNKIIEVSKKLFLEYGFKKTSIKMIALDANISVANIYNYFDNKEGLLNEIVKEAINSYKEFIVINTTKKIWGDPKQWNAESECVRIVGFFKMMYRQKNEFQILCTKVDGSSLEGYYEKMIDDLTKARRKIGQNAIESNMVVIKKRSPKYLTRITIKMYLDIVFEGFRDNLSEREIIEMLRETVYFFFFGYSIYVRTDPCSQETIITNK